MEAGEGGRGVMQRVSSVEPKGEEWRRSMGGGSTYPREP